jgi:hypothetical protein
VEDHLVKRPRVVGTSLRTPREVNLERFKR